MATKTRDYATVNAASNYETVRDKRTPFGSLRIAKVTYDYHPVYKVEDASGQTIGQMIDEHIANTIHSGNLVSEVSLFFETQEQQHELAKLYDLTLR